MRPLTATVFISIFVGTSEILFAVNVAVLFEVDASAVTGEGAAEMVVVLAAIICMVSFLSVLPSFDVDSGSGNGDDGGDVFISSMGMVSPLLLDTSFGADPFSAELLPNCKYADNLGKMSLTSWISLL